MTTLTTSHSDARHRPAHRPPRAQGDPRLLLQVHEPAGVAASDRVEIGGLPVGDDPRRKNPAVSAPHLYPEFEANLRLRHGPGALEVCVRAPFGVDDLSPKSGPPDSPGSMYETSAMRGPGRWAREP